MFRAAAAGPFDDIVAKATDENLTSEDWGAIIEVCDKVSSDQNGSKEAVQSMIKRLAHRNANVQLYTLELAHALCQNCGKQIHREVFSRAFTDALLKVANDRNTHNQVKSKILEKMQEWTDIFSNDAELGVMYDAYYQLKQTNPTLQAPSAPQKQGLTDIDRQKEDDELQMALTLSLQDEEPKKPTQAGSSSQVGSSGQRQYQLAAAPAAAAVPSGTTAATVSRVRALFDFVPSEPGELEFKRGDVITVLESVYKDWWRGSLKGKIGIFPLNYVEKLADPTPEELQREAHMEAEVFAEIKNVEKLLALLSASNTAPRDEDNEEISKLYHQTLAIRPKLIKLIEKYSQKKDDFIQLNEKFIKARRDYEALLESSMPHPPQHIYHQYGMRPGPPGQGYPPAGGAYQAPGPQQHDSQSFYTPTPHDRQPYQASPPPPNFQPPDISPGQQYPLGDDTPRIPPNGKQPAPINTTPPPLHTFAPYLQPPAHSVSNPYSQHPSGQQPLSTYGAQELATSVYDSPVAPNNPSSAVTYSSSVYSQDDLHTPSHDTNATPTLYNQYTPYQNYQPRQGTPDVPMEQPGSNELQYKPYIPPGIY